MHIDLTAVSLRNIMAFQLLAALAFACDSPVVQRELRKIWKTLNTPLLQKQPVKTNHVSNKFWEIDMTKFEP